MRSFFGVLQIITMGGDCHSSVLIAGFPTWQPCRLKLLYGKETEITIWKILSGNSRHKMLE